MTCDAVAPRDCWTRGYHRSQLPGYSATKAGKLPAGIMPLETSRKTPDYCENCWGKTMCTHLKVGTHGISIHFKLVRPAGFEPATLGSEDRCAIQLRHGRAGDPVTGRVRRLWQTTRHHASGPKRIARLRHCQSSLTGKRPTVLRTLTFRGHHTESFPAPSARLSLYVELLS